MITIFNRKELISTFDMKQQVEIVNFLKDNKIDYTINVVNRKSPSPFAAGSRAHTGTLGEKAERAYEYVIYVKKEDYEEACYRLRGRF